MLPQQGSIKSVIDAKNENQIAENLAQNLKSLRLIKAISQDQLAQLAAIPRSTLTNMESGQSNPSLQNLCRVAAALKVSIEELLSAPRSATMLIKADQIPIRKLSGTTIYKLMPDKIKGIEIDRIELAAHASMAGHPHLPGTKEYLITLNGAMAVFVAGEMFSVETGDVLAFHGNQPHSYKNNQHQPCQALSVVLPITSGSNSLDKHD